MAVPRPCRSTGRSGNQRSNRPRSVGSVKGRAGQGNLAVGSNHARTPRTNLSNRTIACLAMLVRSGAAKSGTSRTPSVLLSASRLGSEAASHLTGLRSGSGQPAMRMQQRRRTPPYGFGGRAASHTLGRWWPLNPQTQMAANSGELSIRPAIGHEQESKDGTLGQFKKAAGGRTGRQVSSNRHSRRS